MILEKNQRVWKKRKDFREQNWTNEEERWIVITETLLQLVYIVVFKWRYWPSKEKRKFIYDKRLIITEVSICWML